MNPLEMNTLITAITNQLYASMSPKDFNYLTVFIAELSKSMYSIAILRGICEWDIHPPHHRDGGKEEKKDDKDKEKDGGRD